MDFLELLHLSNDLLESPGHEVGSLWGAVIPLQILEEAEEERVHGHGVNAEETRRYGISAYNHHWK